LVLIATLRSNGPAAEQAGDQAAAPSDAEQRANSLLSQMTLDEKIGLVHGDGFRRDSGYAGHLPGIERLGIPDLYLADGPNGVGNGSTGVTVVPSGMAVSSTWDPQLVEAFGAALGREQAGKGHNVALAPTVNIVRVPQWGRAFESLSEDPWLAGRLGVAVIKGIQSQGVIATVKHYAANNQETRRNSIDVKVSERALREIYLPAFQAAVVEGGVGAVMCSYNRLGGTVCVRTSLAADRSTQARVGIRRLRDVGLVRHTEHRNRGHRRTRHGDARRAELVRPGVLRYRVEEGRGEQTRDSRRARRESAAHSRLHGSRGAPGSQAHRAGPPRQHRRHPSCRA